MAKPVTFCFQEMIVSQLEKWNLLQSKIGDRLSVVYTDHRLPIARILIIYYKITDYGYQG